MPQAAPGTALATLQQELASMSALVEAQSNLVGVDVGGVCGNFMHALIARVHHLGPPIPFMA